ncbi:uncharacterized protein BYT42DRAFT_534381 [Radiomyces spectabilis]|uniref:uncharacterized protein n=1 Tax=Radiomyces spectabilis TaxID=64574 RepID=UPI002220505A|nr:uncharacterized protein BYT42DRAFT_534381 [Radiomyces spectabilis]KAI8376164.1 hypothetical protein BYT42DRAFT_534381 [Radiomyces spectabilis]
MAQRPQSTTELNALAAIQFDSKTPIRLYFRSADLLIKQARVYKAENDLRHAYILYMKYTNLGINELPKHAEYKRSENKPAIKVIRQNCLEALNALETMKPVLDAEYRAYEKRVQAAKEAVKREPPPATSDEGTVTEAQREWSLQEALKGVAGVGYDTSCRSGSVPTADHRDQPRYASAIHPNRSDGFSYHASPLASMRQGPVSPGPVDRFEGAPLLPPKPSFQSPALPPKIALSNDAPALPPKIKLEEPVLPTPSISDTAPSSGATTERGEPLRTLLVPESLHQRFLRIAQPNTSKNIETCGILAGTLKNNILKITTLIIPKQIGTSDTCTTENEEELFEFQDKRDLLTFGWIHTHPTQSCFLSSVDLHTHCSYQLMLPEAIAIVCAVTKKPNFGIFRLTDPPGLDVISTCQQPSAFHPHPDVPIYTDAHGLGHVKVKDYHLEIEDLRT